MAQAITDVEEKHQETLDNHVTIKLIVLSYLSEILLIFASAEFIPVMSPRSVWQQMTVHTERERELGTRQSQSVIGSSETHFGVSVGEWSHLGVYFRLIVTYLRLHQRLMPVLLTKKEFPEFQIMGKCTMVYALGNDGILTNFHVSICAI